MYRAYEAMNPSKDLVRHEKFIALMFQAGWSKRAESVTARFTLLDLYNVTPLS